MVLIKQNFYKFLSIVEFGNFLASGSLDDDDDDDEDEEEDEEDDEDDGPGIDYLTKENMSVSEKMFYFCLF